MTYIHYFTAPWCGPCKSFGPVVEKVLAGRSYVKVNVDADQELAAEAKVRNVPTLVMRDGNHNEISRLIGAHPEEALRKWIETGST